MVAVAVVFVQRIVLVGVQAAGDREIKVTIAIDITECAAVGPSQVGDGGAGGDGVEGAIAVVFIHQIIVAGGQAEAARDKQVKVAIVVDIPPSGTY